VGGEWQQLDKVNHIQEQDETNIGQQEIGQQEKWLGLRKRREVD
jgi:hypothetical protein